MEFLVIFTYYAPNLTLSFSPPLSCLWICHRLPNMIKNNLLDLLSKTYYLNQK